MTTLITSIDRHLSANPIALPEVNRKTVAAAKLDWRAARVLVGSSDSAPVILTGADTKEAKQAKFAKGDGARIAGLTLSPATELASYIDCFDDFDVSDASTCDFSTPQCRDLCLKGTGRQAFDYAALARVARTVFLIRSPESFAVLLVHELNAAARKFGPVAFRPDVLSDLSWDRIFPWLADLDSVAVVYGYTKNIRKARRWNAKDGWYSTFSASERTNIQDIRRTVESGVNVAVPVSATKKDDLPDLWGGLPVVDGDKNDRRYLDSAGSVVLLRLKLGFGNRPAMQSTRVSINSFVKPLAA